MGQSRKRKTLLDSQKPKRRWSVHLPSIKKAAFKGSLALVLALSTYGTYRYLRTTAAFNFEERPSLQALHGLSEAEKNSILEKYRQLSSASPENLEAFSRGLYRGLGLRSIQLIQTAPDKLAIATETFKPKLIVELDRPRFVTEDGIIFGSAASNEGSGLPILKGLYKNASFTKSENETLVLSPANQRIVEEALLAIQEGARYNIQYRSLNYDEFRGLSGDLLEPAYRITIGFRPFDAKYLKLEKVIGSLKDRGLTSASIELDYNGKAFVKETTF